MSEVGTWTVESQEATTQCDEGKSAQEKEKAKIDGSRLSQLTAIIEAELERDDRHLFLDYEPPGAGGSEDVVYKYTLSIPKVSFDRSPLQVVGLSWNATGKALFAAYGRNDVYGWCDDPGIACSWSLFSADFDPEQPAWSLEHPTCLTAVRCHPLRPAVLALGSMVGEVVVCDVGADDEIVATSEIAEHSHSDSITALGWVQRSGQTYDLVSLAFDGKLLFWSVDLEGAERGLSMLPSRGIVVAKTAADVARPKFRPMAGTTMARLLGQAGVFVVGTASGKVLGVRASADGYKKRVGAGPKQVGKLLWEPEARAFLAHLPQVAQSKLVRHVEQFCAGKRVVKKRDIFDAKPKRHYANAPPFGAVTEYEQHEAAVFALAASPFHRNLFVAVGADGFVRVHSALQTRPLVVFDKTIEPQTSVVGLNEDHDDPYLDDKRKRGVTNLTAGDFSKARPAVFAAAGNDATVRVYDLLAANLDMPVLQLKVPVPRGLQDEDLDRHARCFGVAFNPRQRDFLAAADAAGRCHVWQLPWRLANAKPNEVGLIDDFLRDYSFDDEDDEEDEAFLSMDGL